MAMNPEIKAKWVEALRSGKYKQGTTGLHNNELNTFCCLGVLCEVQSVPRNDEAGKYSSYVFDAYPSTIALSGEFASKLGIEDNAMGTVISMNDAHGNSFDEIATYIEENL